MELCREAEPYGSTPVLKAAERPTDLTPGLMRQVDYLEGKGRCIRRW
ncbi:MAG: hypothetical protein ACLRTA_03660 [Clostridia bacterium]